MGQLLTLPAGKLRTSLRVGVEASRLASSSTAAGATSAADGARSDLNAQVSLDVPLTSRHTGFLGAVGNVTANVNGAVTGCRGTERWARSAMA